MTPATISLQRVERMPVAVIRREVTRSELSRVVPECCGRVWEHLRAQQIKGGRNVAIYRNRGAHLEAGVEVAVPFVEGNDVVPSTTPAGTAATMAHIGPYAGLSRAHDAIQAWCRENNHKMIEPCWELYGHWRPEWDTDPSQIRTDVYYLIEG